MSLDWERICELCGENVNGYGHAPDCPDRVCRDCGEPMSSDTHATACK
jgi:hypothetical protein